MTGSLLPLLVVVPLLGAAAGLVQGSSRTVETYRYANDQVVEKVVETSRLLEPLALHPIAVLGGFLALYSFMAVVGILLGVYHRKKGAEIKISP